MNKKILGIILLLVGLTGVLYFTNLFFFKDKQSKENIRSEKPIDYVEEDEEENKKIVDDVKEEESKDPIEIEVGKAAPNFTLKNLEGKEVSLSDYKGKNVLINFWATWCQYCDIEMPDLNAVDKNNEDIVVLAVDVMEDPGKVKKYIEKGGYGFEVVLDEKGDISRNYLVSAFPTTYVVNKEGILMGGIPGMMTKPQLDQVLESLRVEK